EGVARIAETPILRQAWEKDLPVEVHGMIYALADGLLHRLDCSRMARVS
ncbi:MAG: carbonic anhydrase, partial [Gammaproteobacteria bacterium HGW-Gammaproteobacteria-8]